MLKQRVITAVVLLALLVAVLFSGSFIAFALTAAVFFGAAMWECFRLFDNRHPQVGAAIWTAAFLILIFNLHQFAAPLLFVVCAAIWALRLAPSLGIGLPPREGMNNRLLSGVYGISILGCFVAITILFKHSALYLLSAMAIVWIADIGAYFTGKAVGKRKLAPSISPGKSWEGAIGGWIAVMVLAMASIYVPALHDTFAVKLAAAWNGLGFLAVLTVLVAASIVGDLFESQLKRRAGMKDSSNLLPGHGGVLDRIDALIPVLPLVALVDFRL
ncbi:MAG: phosphatidate cytidylyltransferase [Burkholderiales bacterium]|nr:phosphatidate cytidylyltransferase [Burkholderiales bacterium]